MDLRKRSDLTGVFRMALVAVLMLTAFMCVELSVVSEAQAQVSKKGGCTNCHTAQATAANASVTVAVDGTELTLTTVGGQDWTREGSVSIPASTSFEIDFITDGINRDPDPTGGSYQMAHGVYMDPNWETDLGTAPVKGTANTPALTNWNTVWDGNQAQMPQYKNHASANTSILSFSNRAIHLQDHSDLNGNDTGTASSWHTAKGLIDNSGAGADADGVRDRMGSDFVMTTPPIAGTYIFYLIGAGGDGTVGGAKGYVATKLTVTVTGGADGTAPVPNDDVAVSVESGAFVPTAFDVTATFTDPDSAVTSCEYTLDNGGAWSAGVVSGLGPYTCTANVSGQTNGTTLDISMRATSSGGLSAASTYYPTRTVDTLAPTTTDNVPGGWQTSDVTVTLTPADAGSGVASTVYCVDTTDVCVPGTAYAAPFLVSNEGTNHVRYTSTDNLGHVQTVVSATLQIDKTAPTDGGALTPTPADSQITLNWLAASDATSGLASPAYTVRRVAGTTPPANCSTGTLVYSGDLLTATDTGLTNGSDYAYRVCATDVAGLVSAGNTTTAQPVAGCTANTPSFTITQLNQQITAGSGTAVYDVTVNNNDVGGGCANVDFTLNVVSDSNATDFAASTTGAMPLNIAPGGNAATTVTVTAAASPTNWNNNITTLNVSAAGHTTSANQTRTTWINLPSNATLNYNTGETVHIEYQTTTRLSSNGTNALIISDSVGNNVTGTPFSLIEIQQGANWVYFYNWDTSINGEPAETYNIEIVDVTTSASSGVVLGNAANQMVLYSDSNYTTPADIFDDLDIVYVEIQLSSPENGTDNPGGLWVQNWTGTNHDVSADTGIIETQTGGTVYRFNFIFDATKAGLASGDWGYVIWNEAAGPLRSFHRPIQFVTGGCVSCTQSDPTLDILTANQTINTEGGFVDYNIQVTNNDTVSCGPTTFTLTANDSEAGTIFAVPSTFPDLVGNQLTVNGASSANTTLRVTGQAGQFSGTNDTDFSTDAANGHTAQNSFTDFAKRVTTTLSVPDLTVPVVNTTAPSNGSYLNAGAADPYTITGTASDNRGTVSSADVQINGGAWNAVSTGDGYANWTWSWNLPVDGAYTIDARGLDPSTNTGNATQVSVTVDRTAPTTGDDVVAVWTNSDRTVSLSESDATSGIASSVYCVDTADSCSPATAYAGAFGINQAADQETVQYLRYFSSDNAGNTQATQSTPVRIDKKAPVDGAALTPTPGNTQIVLNWNAATDGGSGLDAVNTYKVVRVAGTTPPSDCTAAGIYTGDLLTTTDTGLTNGNDYAYRVCAYDNVGWVSTGLTATAQPAAACVRANPSVAVTANQNIITDSGFVDYTVTVTNNDTGGCAAQTFDVKVFNDSNAVDFAAPSFPSGSTTAAIGPGGNDSTVVVRVTANVGTLNAATKDISISTDGASDPNHADSNVLIRTTTMSVPCTTAPVVNISTGNQTITTDGGNAVYTIRVTNNNASACDTRDFDLTVVDDNSVAFSTPSVFAADPLSVTPNGGWEETTITVTAQVGATNGATNNSYFYTGINGTIPQSSNSNAVTTTINRPCVRNAPTLNHAVNQNIPLDGTATYTLTVTNNDTDCVDNTFTFGINSEVESSVGSFTLPSTFSAPDVTLAAGGTSTAVTFDVVASGAGADNDSVTSQIKISSANHADVTDDVVTTLKQFDPLVHSSLSTGSSKHSGSGGWGVAGGVYGEFTCGTCHSPSTTNIKRVLTAINAPGEAIDGRPVSFLDATEPTTDFGDDSVTPRASSNRICEVCHTYDAARTVGVNKHAYDQPGNSNHYNSLDCTSCHKHNAGFKGSGTCDTCHGYPPDPADSFGYQAVEGKGAHTKHVNHLAALAGITLDPNNDSFGDANVTLVCGVCHDMNTATHEIAGGAGANRLINFNSDPTFQFGASAPAYNGIEDNDSATTPKTCSNLNCHFQATPLWE